MRAQLRRTRPRRHCPSTFYFSRQHNTPNYDTNTTDNAGLLQPRSEPLSGWVSAAEGGWIIPDWARGRSRHGLRSSGSKAWGLHGRAAV